jgi:hypothetical protein
MPDELFLHLGRDEVTEHLPIVSRRDRRRAEASECPLSGGTIAVDGHGAAALAVA